MMYFPQSTKNNKGYSKNINKNIFDPNLNSINNNHNSEFQSTNNQLIGNGNNQMNYYHKDTDMNNNQEQLQNFYVGYSDINEVYSKKHYGFNQGNKFIINNMNSEIKKFPQSTKNSISFKKMFNNNYINQRNIIKNISLRKVSKWNKISNDNFSIIMINEILKSKNNKDINNERSKVREKDKIKDSNISYITVVFGKNIHQILSNLNEFEREISIQKINLIYYNLQFSINFIFSLNFSKKNFTLTNNTADDSYDCGIFTIPKKVIFTKNSFLNLELFDILKLIYEANDINIDFNTFLKFFYCNTKLFLSSTYDNTLSKRNEPLSKYLNSINSNNNQNNYSNIQSNKNMFIREQKERGKDRDSVSLMFNNINQISETNFYKSDRNFRFTSTDTNTFNFQHNNNISNINTQSFVNNGNNDSICELIFQLDSNNLEASSNKNCFNKYKDTNQITTNKYLINNQKDKENRTIYDNDKIDILKNGKQIINKEFFINNINENKEFINKENIKELKVNSLNRPFSVQQQNISPKNLSSNNQNNFIYSNSINTQNNRNSNFNNRGNSNTNRKTNTNTNMNSNQSTNIMNVNINSNSNKIELEINNETLTLTNNLINIRPIEEKCLELPDSENLDIGFNSKKIEKSKSNKSFKNNISDNMNRPNFLQSSIQCENQKVKSNFNTISNTNDRIKKVFVRKKRFTT